MVPLTGSDVAVPIAPEPGPKETALAKADALPALPGETPYEPVSFAEEEDRPRRGAPAWMVTFADMTTLLLAFYVLVLSFSDLNVNRFRDVSGSLQKSLGDKDAMRSVPGPPAQTQLAAGPTSGVLPLSEQLARDLANLQTVLSAEVTSGKIQLRADKDRLVLQVPGQRSAEGVLSQETLDLYGRIADAQAKVQSLVEVRVGNGAGTADDGVGLQFAAIRDALVTEIADGTTQVARDGEHIVVTLAEQGSFYPGSAELSPAFLPLLSKIGLSVKGIGGEVTIEGHTDSVPIGNSDRFRSNWDLSGARSAAVADYLTDRAGVTRERIAVRGLADTRPLAPNDTKEGRAKNRRIEIILRARP